MERRVQFHEPRERAIGHGAGTNMAAKLLELPFHFIEVQGYNVGLETCYYG
jgi:hypothetical protein